MLFNLSIVSGQLLLLIGSTLIQDKKIVLLELFRVL